ncbi:MAG: citrate/2-methylcitrate synthase [Thaumarchaeota archaeon]|nr:citrate/2-methylcitrate synthase [Nitrososphaerota archaeon]
MSKARGSENESTTVKVSKDTQAKLASMGKYGETMDQIIQRLTTQAKGLEDVVAGKSSICFIDGHEGKLLYRGYDIADLAAHSTYEETTFLLWNGHLPTANELRVFSEDLTSKRPIPPELITILTSLPRNCDTMDALRVGVAALGIFDDPMYNQQEKAMSIAAKMGTVVAAIHRHKHDQELIPPRDDLGYSTNFLHMVTGEVPSKDDTRLMDVLLILHADHEFNASTFTARIIASTLSDMYSAVTGAVGALKGPLHGGANEKVVEMTAEIGSSSKADAYIRAKLATKSKINGFGHRVYRTMDPRAKILKEMASKFARSEKEKQALEILERAETILREEKNLYPNVDLFSGLALNHIGIPSYLFTPVFAVGRAPGWLAHVLEQYADNRIIRPLAEYIGPPLTQYVAIEARTSAGVAR